MENLVPVLTLHILSVGPNPSSQVLYLERGIGIPQSFCCLRDRQKQRERDRERREITPERIKHMVRLKVLVEPVLLS